MKPRPGPHPPPPADLASRPLPLARLRGPWFRGHRAGRDPLFFGATRDNRFDDPRGRFGVLYLAADPFGAFIETFGHQTGSRIVTRTALEERALSRVEARRALRVVDLTGRGLPRLGADERLCSGDIAAAQEWSRALAAHPATPDGLLYRARHDPTRLSTAVFDRARGALRAIGLGSWMHRRNRVLLGTILREYRFGLLP